MTSLVFTTLFPFCGLGAGALGFLGAQVSLLGAGARFQSLGGLDLDAEACADFEKLTESPAWCVDVGTVTADQLRDRYGERAPDVVFMSPPCKGSSGLLSAEKARSPKYRAMNGLALTWTRRMLEAWPTPPKLVLLENVPRITTRASSMLKTLRAMLRQAGYVFHAGYHDCGELGGLAQHRRRFLLVARHARSIPPLLYQPPKRRVRGCGEVLGELPLPHAPEAGPMHVLPRLSWLNWVRLALIPAGGDWRDLPGVLEDGEARRERWARHGVAAWEHPTGAVAGSGSNGPNAVADPRLALAPNASRHWNKYAVAAWDDTAGTVIGATRPGSGAPNVADPRVKRAYDAGYAVLRWDQAARTIAGTSAVGCGAYAVADPRVAELAQGLRLVSTEELDRAAQRPDKPPPFLPVIIAADGTWHRPMTTLELAALQSLPMRINDRALVLAGGAVSRWRERIGNAVPVAAARAIAEQMLVTLVHAEYEASALSVGNVWVAPETRTA